MVVGFGVVVVRNRDWCIVLVRVAKSGLRADGGRASARDESRLVVGELNRADHGRRPVVA